MFVPWDKFAVVYLGTKMCIWGAERKYCCISTNAAGVAAGTDFWELYYVLEKVYFFKYLDRLFSSEKLIYPR